jgi:peptidoglycan hydrolase CwlO-like protein
MKKFLKISLFLFFIFSLLFSNFVFSQQNTNLSPQEEKRILEEELKKVLEEIEKINQDLASAQQQKKTLENEIYILKRKIAKLELEIEQNQLMVQSLGIQISETEKSIEKTSQKIEQKKEQIAGILRTIYEEDQKSFFEVLLVENSISNFFDSLNQLELLYSENQKLLDEVKDLKSFLETEKISLEEDKADLEKLLAIQSLQKNESEEIKKEKDTLLEKTKGKESEYQKLLAEKQKRAAEIRSRIFQLMGVAKAPTFGEAYEIAKYVSAITGVRPAFLLAVLYQESRIGQNVGQCYLKNTTTGEGVKANTGQKVLKVMNPSRDVPSFLQITKELGRDPFGTVVSCPMSFGWGGAMGPAQFLPSTWLRYKERLFSIIKKTPDPWEIKDSFLASALYLADFGASEQIPEKEWRAAMIYFAGTVDTRFRWYGDSVIKKAAEFEEDIKVLEGE